MKLLKLSFVVTAFIVGNSVFGQANSVENKTKVRQEQSEVKANQSRPVKNADGYMDKKADILSKLNVKEIPADFPKYKDGQAKEDYKKAIITWMRKNTDLLDADFKKKFEAKHGINK